MTSKVNIFKNISENLTQEIFEDIIDSGIVKIERIISHGHSTPRGEWLCENKNEWVILLSGSAKLLFYEESENRVTDMLPGDYIFIPAQTKHRVEMTDEKDISIWLAVHFV